MELGAFSISLTVKDLKISKDFYEKLGFSDMGISCGDNWTILRNGPIVIGLFEGHFEKNMLTFNPGFDQQANMLENFTDVREIQKQLLAQGVKLSQQADTESKGPAHIMLEDPDGNPILIDQHV
ncbi:VOC family protein [Polycladidibacter stylochi]|uniref:VOC family protein n=1 Tax=Polycladidibacter stylochi TaxID=1807766 RepID=UPI00082B1084|nr:VOC family protein [Pseudovibrio stylochi]